MGTVMKINKSVVHADVSRAIDQWEVAGLRRVGRTPGAEAAADIALALLERATPPDDRLQARFCIATKGHHLQQPRSLACVAARLTAFGVTVRGLHRIAGDAGRVVRSLYPRASDYFAHGPTTKAQWDLLDRRFDTEAFYAIFGRRYDRSMVVSGAAAIRDNALSPADLTDIWEGGRSPVTRDTLVERYGARAAGLILRGHDTYAWFRGPLPVGISRIAAGMTAFAMRDERINHHEPVIVLNGHVPGLADLFAPATWVFDLGLDEFGPGIGDIRRLLAGDDSRPERCQRGSVRRDAVDGVFPLSSDDPVTSRANLLHCSDGLLAGLMEIQGLIPANDSAPDLLAHRLARAGLTDHEVADIVLRNPHVRTAIPAGHLSDLTVGLDVDACLTKIMDMVPPIFGATNGHADGVNFRTVSQVLQRAMHAPTSQPVRISALARQGPRAEHVVTGESEAIAGRDAISRGLVGMLIPAGGTGGRFGGYHVSETDPARQKALAPVFIVAGRPMSALDVRLANVRFWDADVDDLVPTAVMGSPTSEAALRSWRDTLDDPHRKALRIFSQHGIYRLDAEVAQGARRWIDAILRDADGRPSVKPSGTLGLLSSFALSGMMEMWNGRGIEYLAIANGDDVGFRLDPHAVGHLARNVDADGIVIGVPWGYSATVRRNGSEAAVRGDRSGWVIDDQGRPFAEPTPDDERTYDTGGALCLISGPAEPRLSVVETAQPSAALFNTNQFYLKMSALQRIFQHDCAHDLPATVQHISSATAISLEEKTVTLDGGVRHARQISQPLHGILQWMNRCDIFTTTRAVGPDTYSSYATLKNSSDIRFAQLVLDGLERHHGELVVERH
jgi:hypothetical protein